MKVFKNIGVVVNHQLMMNQENSKRNKAKKIMTNQIIKS